jgi:hypothetical protein
LKGSYESRLERLEKALRTADADVLMGQAERFWGDRAVLVLQGSGVPIGIRQTLPHDIELVLRMTHARLAVTEVSFDYSLSRRPATAQHASISGRRYAFLSIPDLHPGIYAPGGVRRPSEVYCDLHRTPGRADVNATRSEY